MLKHRNSYIRKAIAKASNEKAHIQTHHHAYWIHKQNNGKMVFVKNNKRHNFRFYIIHITYMYYMYIHILLLSCLSMYFCIMCVSSLVYYARIHNISIKANKYLYTYVKRQRYSCGILFLGGLSFVFIKNLFGQKYSRAHKVI